MALWLLAHLSTSMYGYSLLIFKIPKSAQLEYLYTIHIRHSAEVDNSV